MIAYVGGTRSKSSPLDSVARDGRAPLEVARKSGPAITRSIMRVKVNAGTVLVDSVDDCDCYGRTASATMRRYISISCREGAATSGSIRCHRRTAVSEPATNFR
jgi:hypothetical protein